MKRCGICLLVTAVVILIAGIAVSVALPKVIRVRGVYSRSVCCPGAAPLLTHSTPSPAPILLPQHDLDKDFLMLPGTKGFNMWKNQSSSSTAGGDNFCAYTGHTLWCRHHIPRLLTHEPNRPQCTDYMYFYNITNPSGMLQGEAPKVEQVGPFRYHYYQENFNISWSEDENVIT